MKIDIFEDLTQEIEISLEPFLENPSSGSRLINGMPVNPSHLLCTSKSN